MKENETSDLVPDWKSLVLKNELPDRVCIKTYISWEEFTVWVQEAQRAGIRPSGLKLIIQNRGLGRKKTPRYPFKPNTKNLSKFIKEKLLPAWKEHELEREMEKRELRKKAEKLGMKVD